MYEAREPTSDELENLPMYVITSDVPWEPSEIGGNVTMNTTSQPSKGRMIVNADAHKIVLLRQQKKDATVYCKKAKVLQCRYGKSNMSEDTWSKVQ